VITGVATESVYEHIDVGKDHAKSIRSSRSADRLRSTPGNVPPEALEIGKCRRLRVARLGSASTAFRPSSTREVRVRPFSAALFLALRRRSPESRMVVLVICQRILCKHQYVKGISRMEGVVVTALCRRAALGTTTLERLDTARRLQHRVSKIRRSLAV